MKRKDFIGKVCPALVLAMMNTPLLVSCSKESEPTNNGDSPEDLIGESGYYFSDNTLLVNINHVNFSDLKIAGSFVNHLDQGVLILRKDATSVMAFDNCCPHQGTINRWSFNGKDFRCNNHGNTYGTGTGSVANCNSNTVMGNLKQYQATLEGSIITINF